MLNWAILRHPMNWFIVLLMVLIAGSVFHLMMRHWENN